MRIDIFVVYVVETYVVSILISVLHVVGKFALSILKLAQIVVEEFVNHV